MKIFTFERRQFIKTDLKTAWNFFTDPANLAKITPPDMNFRVTSELPEKIYPGLLITYKVSPLLGVSVNWVTEITQAVDNNYFIDEQKFGPYKLWHHEHYFSESPGGIEMHDKVQYAIGYGFIGTIMNLLIVKKKLNAIFDYRMKKLTTLFK